MLYNLWKEEFVKPPWIIHLQFSVRTLRRWMSHLTCLLWVLYKILRIWVSRHTVHMHCGLKSAFGGNSSLRSHRSITAFTLRSGDDSLLIFRRGWRGRGVNYTFQVLLKLCTVSCTIYCKCIVISDHNNLSLWQTLSCDTLRLSKIFVQSEP